MRSDRYLGDLAEFLCADALDIDLASNLRKIGHDGTRVEVRVQVKYGGGKKTNVDLGDPDTYQEIYIVLGEESTLWQAIQARQLPEHYWWQAQHQLLVTRADVADVFVFDGSEGIVFPVAPERESWLKIQAAWDEFSRLVTTKAPPPLTKGDVVERNDAEWECAATAYVDAKRQADSATRLLDEAKARLVTLTQHTSETGAGVTLTRFWRSGAIDYKRVPQLHGVDLEQYRAPHREEVRITVATR